MILTDAGINSMTDGCSAFKSWIFALAGLHVCAPQACRKRSHAGPVASLTAARFQAADAMSPQPATGRDTAEETLTPREQRARVIALRGLSQLKSRDLDAARSSFAEAIRLDPALDLCRLPSFWQLPRQAHDVVVDVLYDAGRHRDAAVLVADLRTRFRPRLLPPRASR